MNETVRHGDHDVLPFLFDPAKLDGLSGRLLVSHCENYGVVRNLNREGRKLGRVTSDALVIAGVPRRLDRVLGSVRSDALDRRLGRASSGAAELRG